MPATLLASIAEMKTQLDRLRPLRPHALAGLQKHYDVHLTYKSNAIEGNTLTLRETAEVIEHGLTVGGKRLRDHLEAVDHYEALQWMREAIVLLAAIVCFFFSDDRGAWAGELALSGSPVASAHYVEIGEGRLYVEIRGDHADAPLLIWLHGGPGGAERPLFRYFNGDLERRFLVAYYDQRGAGRSFDPDKPPAWLTVARHVEDLDRLLDRLRTQYRKERVLLVGHSWGAALGMLYAKEHPEKVAALVCVAPLVSRPEQMAREYEFDLREAAARKDSYALSELQDLGPPPYESPERVIRLQRVTERYGGVEHHAHNHAAIVVEGVLKGLVTPWEVVRIVQGMTYTQKAMHPELLSLDLRRRIDRLEVPLFFLLGRHDHHVDASVASDYFDHLHAPLKELVWFEESAHEIPFDEPLLFDATVARLAERAEAR